jgi:hypothetical protein
MTDLTYVTTFLEQVSKLTVQFMPDSRRRKTNTHELLAWYCGLDTAEKSESLRRQRKMLVTEDK